MLDFHALFSDPMAVAVVQGRKGVTRRPCKAQPRIPGIRFKEDVASPGVWLYYPAGISMRQGADGRGRLFVKRGESTQGWRLVSP